MCAVVVAVLMAASCDMNKKHKETIAGYLPELNTELRALAAGTDLLEEASMELDDKTLKVEIEFATEQFKVSELSEPLVQYTLSLYMKSHTGARLDNILNALGNMSGEVEIELEDVDGDSRTFIIPSSRMKQLVRLRPMELNFNEVRNNVTSMMQADCNTYRMLSAGAESATFRLQGGFAEYTVTFPSTEEYRGYTQANLAGKFVNVLRPQYQAYGTLRPLIMELMESLQIDGYRFIYTTPSGDGAIRAAIPWRLID